jgi:hypothetical protein
MADSKYSNLTYHLSTFFNQRSQIRQAAREIDSAIDILRTNLATMLAEQATCDDEQKAMYEILICRVRDEIDARCY